MKIKSLMVLLLCIFLLSGCKDDTIIIDLPEEEAEETEVAEEIVFADDQLYAVAYLGYGEMADLSFYQENYLEEDTVPIHYFSGGEYYLIIPRYEDMRVCLYRNDMETMEKELVYESDDCESFIIQCNISDIFPDATIELVYQGETVGFSPYISLKDGSVMVGERGLDITAK